MPVQAVGDNVNLAASGAVAPEVTYLSNGNYVVVAHFGDDEAGSATSTGIYGYIFTADDVLVTGPFLMNTTVSNTQSLPTVAASSDGGFLVVWEDASEINTGSQGWQLRGQLFENDGTASGSEFLVNTTESLNQRAPEVVSLSDGGYVVAWTDNSPTSTFGNPQVIRFQIYDSSGNAVGGEQTATQGAPGSIAPDIAALSGGGFVMTWGVLNLEANAGAGTYEVYGRVFEADGTPVADSFLVNTTLAGAQDESTIFELEDGNFIVVWRSPGEGFFHYDLRGQIFTAEGVRVGEELLLADEIGALIVTPEVVGHSGGGFFVTWEQTSIGDDPMGIFGRAFNADGSPEGDAFQINDPFGGAVNNAEITRGPNGFLVVWQETGSPNPPTIRAQHFDDIVSTSPTEGPDELTGTPDSDTLDGLGGDDIINGLDAGDTLTGGSGDDEIDGGANVDTAIFSGDFADYTITTNGRTATVEGPDGTDTLTNVEYFQFDDQTFHWRPGTGQEIDFGDDPDTFMSQIRDFDGNDVGASGSWELLGSVDLQGDGDLEYIFTNRDNGRWASVGPVEDGLVYFDDHGWAGDTRVVGIYIDPLVQSGDVEAGSDEDSQRRFQNDLEIGNIAGILGADDYDGDGLQEIYFSLTDGTAYLHAYMHADGNIRYANYQSQGQVEAYMEENDVDPSVYSDWFGAPAGLQVPDAIDPVSVTADDFVSI